MSTVDRAKVDALLEQAYSFIQQGYADKAIAAGNQLLEVRHARGFEIIALAYEQQGRSADAIKVLDAVNFQTLNLNSSTSPSLPTYSLPSMRYNPFSRAPATEPHFTRSSYATVSALMKPRWKSP